MPPTYTLTPTTLVNYPTAEGEVDVVYCVIATGAAQQIAIEP